MIGSLRGVVLDRQLSGELLVEVGGVGYRVQATPGAAQRLAPGPVEVFLWVYHHLREDHQSLYGFTAREERDCFEALLGAHGVGPALALAILSVHTPKELVRILAEDDLAALCLVPGVGKKTAARLVIELRSRLDVGILERDGVATPGSGSTPRGDSSPRAVVRQALAELGYAPDEIRRALDDLPDVDAAVPAGDLSARSGGGAAAHDEAALLRAARRRLARP
jgi:Holliday junction DNA helicase RuvA